jgi:hypothetical protein
MKALVLLAVLAACGPSSSEVRTAKLAEYNTTPTVLLRIAADAAAAQNYKIGNITSEELVTRPRVYEREGGLESAGADNWVQIRPGSVSVSFIVKCVVTDDKSLVVQVTPKTFEWLSGSPQPRELTPDDPNLPPWILGRADQLQLAIYERAKPYALAPPGAK